MSSSSTRSVRYIALGWSTFTSTHVLMSHPPIRDGLVESFGETTFMGLYSAIALAAFVPTTYIYSRYGAGKGNIPGWTNVTQTRAAKFSGTAMKALAAIGFGQAISNPSPVAASPKTSSAPEDPPKAMDANEKLVAVTGINRITRHGMFASLALLGIGNIVTRGHAGDVAYWAGYPVVFLLGCAHQDMRQRATLPKSFYDQTSMIPFQAILEGRNSLTAAVGEFNKPALVTAIVAPLFLM